MLGHEVRITPAGYEKPYVKRNKNGAADAEPIREAVTRPTMRFVAVKTTARQSLMMLHPANFHHHQNNPCQTGAVHT